MDHAEIFRNKQSNAREDDGPRGKEREGTHECRPAGHRATRYFVWGWLGPYYSNEPRILTQSSTKQYLMGA